MTRTSSRQKKKLIYLLFISITLDSIPTTHLKKTKKKKNCSHGLIIPKTTTSLASPSSFCPFCFFLFYYFFFFLISFSLPYFHQNPYANTSTQHIVVIAPFFLINRHIVVHYKKMVIIDIYHLELRHYA